MQRRLLRHVRAFFRIQPGKPAVSQGIRAAVAVTVPFSLASLSGFKEAGWTGLAGLLVTLSDRSGAYRGRARVMATVTLLGALVGALAAPAGAQVRLDAWLLLVGVFAASFARSYGETAGSVGEKLAVIFVASLGSRAVGIEEAAARGSALLFGGLWAMLQSLVLWPLHRYLPARKAIAHVYWSLADATQELSFLTRLGADPETWSEATTRHAPVRLNIEHARETLAATRVGRPDEPRRFEHLLVLLELSERIVAMLVALAQSMEVASPEEPLRPVRERVARFCNGYAALQRWVARVVRDPSRTGDFSPNLEELGHPEQSFCELPTSVAELLMRLRNYANSAQTAAAAMQRGHPVSHEMPRAVLPATSERRPWFEPLRENLAPHSIVLRHALRAGLVASSALVVTHALHLGEAYWVVLSAIGILQPYSTSTEERALQRVAGTLLGGTLAAVLAGAVGSQFVMLLVIGTLTAISVSLLPLNFGVFQVLLTPDFLLLATLSAGDWTVAENRARGVVIACILALAGAWLLWPISERRRFPDAAANVLRADGNYFRKVAESRSGTEPAVWAARRNLGLALLDAEASFDRLVAEYRGPAHRLEPAMALLTYSRRLAASVTALGEQLPAVRSTEVLDHVANEASGRLESLADSLQEGRPPPPMPPLPLRRSIDDPVTGALMERVPRQLEILHRAVEKLTAEVVLLPRRDPMLAARGTRES